MPQYVSENPSDHIPDQVLMQDRLIPQHSRPVASLFVSVKAEFEFAYLCPVGVRCQEMLFFIGRILQEKTLVFPVLVFFYGLPLLLCQVLFEQQLFHFHLLVDESIECRARQEYRSKEKGQEK